MTKRTHTFEDGNARASSSASRTPSLSVRDLRSANERLLIRSILDQESAESAEEGRAQLNALVEAMSEGIAIAEADGRLVVLNRSGCTILGVDEWSLLTVADLERVEILDVDGVVLGPAVRPLARALRGERFVDTEVLVVRADGERRELLASGTSIVDGDRVALALVVFRDVTEVRRVERQRDEYLALISHDLRAPLAAILLLSQSMQVRPLGDGVRVDDRAARIERSANKINAMVTDLLETSSGTRKNARVGGVPVDLVALVAEIVDLLPDAARARVTLCDIDETPCIVVVEPGRIGRAFENLLSNALKYSRAGVEARLERRDGWAILSVTDHGVGISKEDLPRVFDRYYRADSGLRMGSGFGLGLYITRLIVDAHGGHAEVASTLGEGSTFRLVLPLKPENA